jgi:hypothetical protein
VSASNARQRSRVRGFGIAGSALAVVAVGTVGLATGVGSDDNLPSTAGGGSTGPAVLSNVTTSSTAAVSPVKHITSGDRITVGPGYSFTTTATTLCETAPINDAPASGPDQTICSDVTKPYMTLRPGETRISSQFGATGTDRVIVGEYQGDQAPSLIDIVNNGNDYIATIVKVDGMNDWVGYYVTFSVPATVRLPANADDFTVKAYDAEGHLLAQDSYSGGKR